MKKRLIKVLCVAMVLMMAMTCTTFANDWDNMGYGPAVNALINRGVITGDTDGLFHGDNHLTRAQACKIVVATIGPDAAALEAAQNAAGFSDMAGAKWAAPYVGYAAANGMVKGYADGTFRPSGEVTVAELCAMLVRAAGKESAVTGSWPTNYVNAAASLGLFKDTGLVDVEGNYPTNNPAAKWMAAWLTYNALSHIDAAQPAVPDTPSNTYGKLNNPTFCAKGTVSDDISTYNGMPISSKAVIYTYGRTSDYKESMTFDIDGAHFADGNINKCKGITMPAWVEVTNGRITGMIIPVDAGFSGKAYGVVTGGFQTINANGDAVDSLETLVAGHEISWAAQSTSVLLPTAAQMATAASNGAIFEMSVKKGEITSLTSDPAAKTGKKFTCLTDDDWVTVTRVERSNYLIELGSNWYEINEKAPVYELNDDHDSYELSDLGSIRPNDQVRLYDISDDKSDIADIVVVCHN